MNHESLGARVRKYREMKDVSREKLAERAGVAPELLSSVEEDDVYPSLGPLLKIARGLGVRLGTFLDDKVSTDPLVVRKREQQEEFRMHGAKEAPVALKYYSLAKGKTDRHMEPFFVEIFPSSEDDRELSSHEGEEFIVVLSGEIEVIYGTKTYHLKAGDSVYYNSVVPHHVGTANHQKAEINAVIYLPD